MAGLEVTEVTSKRHWKSFFTVPFRIYKEDPNWVPHLLTEENKRINPKINPFFSHGTAKAWLVRDSTGPIGRIMASIDPTHNHFHNERIGFIGYFECVDSQKAANLLFGQADAWLLENQMTEIRGPINLSITNESGLLIEGFETPPFINMNHGRPYYAKLFETYGFQREHRLLAYLITERSMSANQELMDRMEKIQEKLEGNKGIRLRSLDMKRFDKEIENVFRIYNEVMKDNWGFVPARRDEMKFMAKGLKFILDPHMVLIVERKGQVIGCSLGVPNINQILPGLNGKLFPLGIFKLLYNRKKIDSFRLMLLGVLPEFRERGIDVMLYLKTLRKAEERGYRMAELSWISEDNKNLIGILQKLGAELYKTYNVYKRPLTRS